MVDCNSKSTVEVDKDYLSCCICFNLMTVPKILGCCHTFCRHCLQKYIDHQADAVQKKGFDCPVCNQFATIPNPVAGWADQFPTDFRIQSMIGDTSDSGDKPDVAEAIACRRACDIPAPERTFTLVNTIPTKTSEDKHNPRIVDLTVLKQEGLDIVVVCDSDNTCVKAFWFEPLKDRELSCKLVVDALNDIALGRMAKINETQIALSLFQTTKLYIVNVNNGLSIHTTIETENNIMGIGVIKTEPLSAPETRLVVGFEGGLSILDIAGAVLKSMTIDISGSTFTGRPWYIKITPTCNILASDRFSCLLCVSQKREVKWRYPTKEAAGIDCDGQGHIYLAVCAENKVVLLSPEGKLLKEVLSHKDHIQNPRGIFYDSEKGRLHIAELNGLVKIFEHK